jgi:crossover junction endodeoxyribonuclease RuvC
MRILGIDPGTATTGYGIVDIGNNGKSKVVEWGLIETEKDGQIEKRLEIIHKETYKLIRKSQPDLFAMEKVFFATNAKTVIAVGQAQGVLLMAASRAKVKVVEYAPGTIKKTITGNGRANKKDVQRSIRKMLGNHVRSKKHKKTHFDNAADALAVALTHVIQNNGVIL